MSFDRLALVAPGQLWSPLPGLGTEHKAVMTEGITRADLARYAGASGDVNAVHVDDEAAAAAGHPSVIAHGMYVMGLSGTFLQRLVGAGTVHRYGARFRSPVLLGDPLTCTAQVTGLDASTGRVALSLTTHGRDGAVVLSGTAEVSPPQQPANGESR